jgi:hypothetical protein
MKKILGIAIGASIAIGAGMMATAPAQAGSITNVSFGGTNPTDYYVYDVDGNKTVLVPSTLANAQKVLDGNAASPTGNVELAASSEVPGFDFTKNTSLTGQIGDKDITLSSLILSDWNTTYKNTGKTFGQYWFEQFYNAAGLASKETQIKVALGLPNITPSAIVRNAVFTKFQAVGGLQRSSDPNIAYVNQDDNTGLIKIGLTGHYTLKSYYGSILGSFANFLNDDFQASEVVKYTYNGVTDYLYSFSATNSGLTSDAANGDHSGNYEVTIPGTPPTKVPEPSVMLGLLGVAGMFVTQRKLQRSV